MSVPISAATKAVLDDPNTEIITVVEIIADLLDGDTRQVVDVSGYIISYSTQTGDSTLRSESWTKPGMTPKLRVDESGFCLPGHPDSLWTAIGKSPNECFLRIFDYVQLPSGALEEINRYLGRITDFNDFNDEDERGIELVTVHVSDEFLSAKITKMSAGDWTSLLGGSW